MVSAVNREVTPVDKNRHPGGFHQLRWIIGRVSAGTGFRPTANGCGMPAPGTPDFTRVHLAACGWFIHHRHELLQTWPGALRPLQVRPHPRPAGIGGDLDCREALTGRRCLSFGSSKLPPNQRVWVGLTGSWATVPGSGGSGSCPRDSSSAKPLRRPTAPGCPGRVRSP